jgi:hypothetical protein
MKDIYLKLKSILDKISPLIENTISKNEKHEEINISSVVAGLIDLGEGFYKIYFDYLEKLTSKKLNKNERYEVLFDIEDELINHLLPHINDMKSELRKIVNSLE